MSFSSASRYFCEVRDYLETLTWDKTPPAPKLPADVISRTSQKYREALEKLTGRKLQ